MGRYGGRAVGVEVEKEVEEAVAKFDRTFAAAVGEDPEAALRNTTWERGVDRRSYCRRNGRAARRGTHDLQRLTAEHHTILDLTALGMSRKDVAAAIGCTPEKVAVTKASTLGQQKLTAAAALRAAESVDVLLEVNKLLPKALAVYAEILDDDEGRASMALKKRTADTLVLKVGGYEAPKRLDVRSVNFKAKDLDELRERGMRYAREAGLLVSSQAANVGVDAEGDDK